MANQRLWPGAGEVRNPREWVADPAIASAARAAGWDKATGNLALLTAIISTESEGKSHAFSEDDCVGLAQFNPKENLERFERHERWGPQITSILERHDIDRPTGEFATWFHDPRTSIVYTGFVLQDQFAQLARHRNPAYRDNLMLALQGYNGGRNDLITPGAVEREARQYPEKVAAYLSYQSKHAPAAEQRAEFADTLERLLDDAERVGQRGRIEAGIVAHRHTVAGREILVPQDSFKELMIRAQQIEIRFAPMGDTALNEAMKGDRDLVRAVQKKLNANGFDCGKVDGIWGKRTEKAFADWEITMAVGGLMGVRPDHEISAAEFGLLTAPGVKASSLPLLKPAKEPEEPTAQEKIGAFVQKLFSRSR